MLGIGNNIRINKIIALHNKAVVKWKTKTKTSLLMDRR